jgi:hypothetical protein
MFAFTTFPATTEFISEADYGAVSTCRCKPDSLEAPFEGARSLSCGGAFPAELLALLCSYLLSMLSNCLLSFFMLLSIRGNVLRAYKRLLSKPKTNSCPFLLGTSVVCSKIEPCPHLHANHVAPRHESFQ